MKMNRIELSIRDLPSDLREKGEHLARLAGVQITECQAIHCDQASAGKVILQMSPTKIGRLLVGHHRIDWEFVNVLIAGQPFLKPKKIENERRTGK